MGTRRVTSSSPCLILVTRVERSLPYREQERNVYARQEAACVKEKFLTSKGLNKGPSSQSRQVA
eukprot:1153395-Pelagomonas_calceolata.AAC.1